MQRWALARPGPALPCSPCGQGGRGRRSGRVIADASTSSTLSTSRRTPHQPPCHDRRRVAILRPHVAGPCAGDWPCHKES
jgi:hypothetical protein